MQIATGMCAYKSQENVEDRTEASIRQVESIEDSLLPQVKRCCLKQVDDIDVSDYLKSLCQNKAVWGGLPMKLRQMPKRVYDQLIQCQIKGVFRPHYDTSLREAYLRQIESDINNFLDIPIDHIDNILGLAALKKLPTIGSCIPNKDKAQWLIYLKACGNALIEAPEYIRKDKDCCLVAVKSRGSALKYVSRESIDLQISIAAVTQSISAINFLYEEHFVKELNLRIMTINPCSIRYIPMLARDKEICLLAVAKELILMDEIPTSLLDKQMCEDILRLCEGNVQTVKSLLKKRDIFIDVLSGPTPDGDYVISYQHRNLDSKDYLERLLNFQIQFAAIPVTMLTEALCLAGVRMSLNNLKLMPKKFKTPKFYIQLLKERVLLWSEIPETIQNEIDENVQSIPLTTLKDSPYNVRYDYHHSMQLRKEISKNALNIPEGIYNEFFDLCYSDVDISDATSLKYAVMDKHEESLLKKCHVFGGRTLHGGTDYFKFWRSGENLEVFLREYKTVQVLSQKKEQLGLESEVPEPISICRLIKTEETKALVSRFSDAPQVLMDLETLQSYYLVYHYAVSERYGLFAHQKNIDADDPYREAEDGLLKGIYDIGRLARNGILYTNVLPAFHGTPEDSWLILPYLFCNRMPFPGSISQWCTKATDYPDFGYSGLRDFGDFSLLGTTVDYLRRGGLLNQFELSWMETQKLSLYNSVNENIFATILLYARLHRDDPSYHYKNTESIRGFQVFIHTIIERFLRGYLEDCSQSVHEIMRLSSVDYARWLEIVSVKLIYWTSKQIKNTDCYTSHLVENRELNRDIYPNQIGIYLSSEFDPDHGYLDVVNDPMLGIPHKPSVCMNLFEGLALLSRYLEKKKHETIA